VENSGAEAQGDFRGSVGAPGIDHEDFVEGAPQGRNAAA